MLDPRRVHGKFGELGRWFYDADTLGMWERDTRTLSRSFRELRTQYRDFAREHLAPKALAHDLDPKSVNAPEIFRAAAAHGFQTQFMPWPWGTMNIRASARSLILSTILKTEEFCAADAGVGVMLTAHDLGVAPILMSATRKGYTHWLRRIYRDIFAGKPAIAAFAVTEPSAGSDAQSTEGSGVAKLSCFYEKADGGFRLNGRKCFITNGAAAQWVTLFAAQRGAGLETWTCFLVDKSMPGFSVGRSERKLGQRATDASELILENVFVPRERVIGRVGAGWMISRNVLNFSRPVVGAVALGIARGAFESAIKFCAQTPLNGKTLLDDPDVQLSLSDMLMKLAAMRATLWQTAQHRVPFQTMGAIAKVFCSDTAWDVCNTAMALMGEHGTVHAHGVEKMARDARLTQIYEGTNEINRLAIFEGQQLAEFRPGLH
jgi:alkylation response protein AidB-like acyl-CoA dehydrogenase